MEKHGQGEDLAPVCQGGREIPPVPVQSAGELLDGRGGIVARLAEPLGSRQKMGDVLLEVLNKREMDCKRSAATTTAKKKKISFILVNWCSVIVQFSEDWNE